MNARSSCIAILIMIVGLCAITAGCSASGKNKEFFGKTDPPRDNILRYVTGSEPESLDPQVSASQPEQRIYMALYEGLVEYDPKTTAPVPGLAESWEIKNSSEFTFHLRHNGRFSNGDPITAHDFVYTIRRGLSPDFASRNAALGYYIRYAQAYNERGVFVADSENRNFLLEENSPERVVLPGDESKRSKLLDANPNLKAAVAGKQFVPVKAEDIGVEAVDEYTLRISLSQRAPFFLSLLPNSFFSVVHQATIEKFGPAWTDPHNIVTSGPFTLEKWAPYDRIAVKRDPMYYDAASVKLDGIVFYAVVDNNTIMNLYKAGEIDAMLNHGVPAQWLDAIASMKDYMDAPEASLEYYQFDCTRPPTNDLRVRRALNMSVDKALLSAWRHAKPATGITPDGIFPGYPQAKGDGFDPEKAKRLLADVGYRDSAGNFDPQKFPVDHIEINTNPDGANIPIAEFIQAQWKQNLGFTIPIKVMENRTFLAARAQGQYKGIARNGWAADYMDPFTFLALYYTPNGNNGTGWWDQRYVDLLDEANRTADQKQRLELLAKAERLALEAQPIMPLLAASARWMKKPYVKGLYPNPASLFPWKWVYIERDPAKWDYGMPDMSESPPLGRG